MLVSKRPSFLGFGHQISAGDVTDLEDSLREPQQARRALGHRFAALDVGFLLFR